jgi:hypothetical protein
MHQRVEPQNRRAKTELAQLFHAQDRCVAADQRIADLRHVEGAANARELLDAARRLDENAVGARTDEALGPPHGVVKIVDRARIRAGENPGVRIEALRACRLDLRFRDLERNDLLAKRVPAAFRPLLIFDQDRAHAHAFIALDGVHDVLDIAVAVVAVDKNRQIAGRHDVTHGRGDLAEAL